jgi:hypothetical protein
MGVHEQLIEKRINELGASVTFISALAEMCGIPSASSARLSAAFQGKALPNVTVERMWMLLNELRDFVHEFEPIPVRLKNAAEIKELLDMWRLGQLKVGTERSAFITGLLSGLNAGEDNGSI